MDSNEKYLRKNIGKKIKLARARTNYTQEKLAEKGHNKIENILYCEWSLDEEKILIETYDQVTYKKIPIDD